MRGFVADSMLEKLARYLRCCGADAYSDRGASRATLIEIANREDRYFLTRNRHLAHHHPLPSHEVQIESDDPLKQIRQLLDAGLVDTSAMFTRCIKCNRTLVPIDRDRVRERVPEGVFESYRRFFTCDGCGTVFWLGSHVRNTCRKLDVEDVSDCG